jgi:hypothetical protein
LVANKGVPADQANQILQFFIFGVTIVVVAVPEGLPLAVTISLAYRHVAPHLTMLTLPSYGMRKHDQNFELTFCFGEITVLLVPA